MPSSSPTDLPSSRSRSETFTMRPGRLVLWLAAIVTFLTAAHLVVNFIHYGLGHDFQWGFEYQFNLNNESNIPTWYSTSALLLAAVLLACIGATKHRRGDAFSKHWLWLAGIFFYLSADEACSFHEQLRVFDRFHFTGFLHYSWVIGGASVVLLIGLAYLRFLISLTPPIRWLFVAAGMIYVGGALGLESISARLDEAFGKDNLLYNLVGGMEEVFEMAGVLVFIYALTQYLEMTVGRVSITFSHAVEQTSLRALDRKQRRPRHSVPKSKVRDSLPLS